MALPGTGAKKTLPIKRLVVVGVIALVVVLIALQFVGWQHAATAGKELFHWGLGLIVSAGPVVFFAAMALLPAIGAPTSAFSLAAGPAFGRELGTGTVVLLGTTVIVLNLVYTYWLARRGVRPLATRLLARFGYAIPTVRGGDATELIVLLRVTPGVPFFVQNYLLGVAEVPFGRYLAISCLIQVPLNAGFIIFGDALAAGRGAAAITAISIVTAIVFAAHLVRKSMAKSGISAEPERIAQN